MIINRIICSKMIEIKININKLYTHTNQSHFRVLALMKFIGDHNQSTNAIFIEIGSQFVNNSPVHKLNSFVIKYIALIFVL